MGLLIDKGELYVYYCSTYMLTGLKSINMEELLKE